MDSLPTKHIVTEIDMKAETDDKNIHEACGVLGYYCIKPSNCIENFVNALSKLQHRGRESTGISYVVAGEDSSYNTNNTANNEKSSSNDKETERQITTDGYGSGLNVQGTVTWNVHKGFGEVKDVFKNKLNPRSHQQQIKTIIGHNRYSTSAKSLNATETPPVNQTQTLQPFYNSKLNIAFVHNGNIQGIDYTQNDSFFIFNIIADLYTKNYNHNMEQCLRYVLQNYKGVYCIVIQTSEGLFAIRDRYGVRPLFIGAGKDTIVVGSETTAFDGEFSIVKEIGPGELYYIGNSERVVKRTTVNEKYIHKLYTLPRGRIDKAFCMFEYFYFMNHESCIDNSSLYEYRHSLGIQLAAKETTTFARETTVVVGSPNSGIAAGQGYAMRAALNYTQAILKYVGVGRTFIMPSDQERKSLCEKAFYIENAQINGKDVIVVDDTIVRGNTFKTLVSQLRENGARSVHVRVASPEIISTCNMGIDIPTVKELFTDIAKTHEERLAYLNVDSLTYLTNEEVKQVIGENVCTKICGCFKGGNKMLEW